MPKQKRRPLNTALVSRALGAVHRGKVMTGEGYLHAAQLLAEMDNVGNVCKEHEPKPGGFIGQDPASFVGKHVKLGFPTAEGSREHMWVWVERVEAGELIGSLKNEPTLRLAAEFAHFHHSDLLAFTVDEIEGVEPLEN